MVAAGNRRRPKRLLECPPTDLQQTHLGQAPHSKSTFAKPAGVLASWDWRPIACPNAEPLCS